jgi:hypothetical protein
MARASSRALFVCLPVPLCCVCVFAYIGRISPWTYDSMNLSERPLAV